MCFPVSGPCCSAHIMPNFPDKKFVLPWEVVFFPSPALEGTSIVTYLIWNPPAVTEASDRNFRVITLPGTGERKTKVMFWLQLTWGFPRSLKHWALCSKLPGLPALELQAPEKCCSFSPIVCRAHKLIKLWQTQCFLHSVSCPLKGFVPAVQCHNAAQGPFVGSSPSQCLCFPSLLWARTWSLCHLMKSKAWFIVILLNSITLYSYLAVRLYFIKNKFPPHLLTTML